VKEAEDEKDFKSWIFGHYDPAVDCTVCLRARANEAAD
jgi:hypothetical protein